MNGTVTKLNLNSNAISDQGVKYLANVLSDEKALQNLFRASQPHKPNFHNSSPQSQCRICKLAMWCDNKLGDQGAQYLANALKVALSHCVHLLLLFSSPIHRFFVLQHNQSVREVYVNGKGVTELGAGYLADATRVNDRIEKLKVESTGIQTEGSRLTRH